MKHFTILLLIISQLFIIGCSTSSISRKAAKKIEAAAIQFPKAEDIIFPGVYYGSTKYIMDINKPQRLVVTCAKGIVPCLSAELEQQGYDYRVASDSTVEISATLFDAMKLNLTLRSAMSVLCLLKQFPCSSSDNLYREVITVPWEDIIDPGEYLTVVSHVNTDAVNNSIFVNQRVKDAVVDRLVKKFGSRPDSGPDRDNIVINLYWKGNDCSLYLNTSGVKLSNRGYRKIPHTAPLQETLAASILAATGYDGSQPLVNPMCGSGTIAIEAALIALNRAPGLFVRDNYALNHVKGANREVWEDLRAELSAQAKAEIPMRIVASDRDKRAVEASKKNAIAAGVDQYIDFYQCEFQDTPIPDKNGIIILNPEYGIRLGQQADLKNTYKNIGNFFKQKCAGSTGYVFTGNMTLAKRVGLRPARRLTFYNAKIECRLLEYPLYAGKGE